jgi:hypothetical protein
VVNEINMNVDVNHHVAITVWYCPRSNVHPNARQYACFAPLFRSCSSQELQNFNCNYVFNCLSICHQVPALKWRICVVAKAPPDICSALLLSLCNLWQIKQRILISRVSIAVFSSGTK